MSRENQNSLFVEGKGKSRYLDGAQSVAMCGCHELPFWIVLWKDSPSEWDAEGFLFADRGSSVFSEKPELSSCDLPDSARSDVPDL